MTLSAPLIWVVLPIIAAVICLIFNERRIFGLIFASLTSLGLALLAAFFPEDLTFKLGRFIFIFQESLTILGRQITLSYSILPFIAFVYAMTGLWALTSNLQGVSSLFRPASLIITALLTAALGVEPFLYAALLIEMAILVSIPMLNIDDHEDHKGTLRYLSFMTIGMPFILIAGWLMTGVVNLPPESPLVTQTILVLGLGFAIWLAVFPFHSWVPMVTQRSQATSTSFLLFVLPTFIFVFGLNFIDWYEFIRISASVAHVLRVVGVVMVMFGGIWTAAQDDLKRAFGFSFLVETGISLMALGLAEKGGLQLLLMLLPARGLGYWLWGYSIAKIEYRFGSLKMESLRNIVVQVPFLYMGLLFAQFSVAGLPLLASFPIKLSLFTIAATVDKNMGIWIFIGNLGLFLLSIRLLLNVVRSSEGQMVFQNFKSEKPIDYLPILFAIIALVLFGLFPGTFLFWLTKTLEAFPHLQ